MISRLKIKYKFLAIHASTILVVLLIAGVLSGLENLRINKEYFDARIYTQAELVAGSIVPAVLFDDPREARVILSALESDEAILGASLNYGSEVVSVSFREAPPSPDFDPYGFISHADSIGKVAVPVENLNREIASLEVVYHDGELHSAVLKSFRLISLEISIALLLGVLLFMAMQSSIIRPIHKLSALAKYITQSKDYSLRGQSVYPDEIGGLTRDFNLMLDIIEQRNQTLEDTVLERTKQLEHRNLELAIQITERERSEKARRETEKKFRQAYINAPIGMSLVNAERRILRPNRVLEQILGHNLGHSLPMSRLVRAEHQDVLRELFDRLVSGEIDKFELDVECFGNDDREIYAILSLSSVRDDSDRFQYAVLQLRDVTESRKLREKLEYQAKHDDLTGLPNRRVLQEMFSQKTNHRFEDTHVLCVLDLDQFKVVNDSCGHAAGDELLCQVAKLLEKQVRSEDLVVRLGGDEFAVMLCNCDLDSAKGITESIRDAIERLEFVWLGQTFRVGASIGAITIRNTQTDIPALLQQADSACYIAKDMGRNRVYIIDSDYDQEICERQTQMRWVQRLHEALEEEDFVLFAQPIVPLQADEPEKRIEILLRMRDKNTGALILPGAFIPAAERYGLITKIDTWVVSALIRALKANPKLAKKSASYWVNLSGLSLGDDSFLRQLEPMIEDSGLSPGLINFEITETAMIQNIAKLSPSIARLQKLGCKFALDDFGSGTSSFGYLKTLPVEYLKVDGMFVRNILHDKVDLIFVKSIIDIAKVMGIKVVSEFVESEEIAEKLTEIGADYGQGYALGRPIPLLLDVNYSTANPEKSKTVGQETSFKSDTKSRLRDKAIRKGSV